jgi:tRNA dimethylallyltransferase
VIVNADSQQIYRELRILTARPSPEEEALVPHRLYGVLPAAETCSAGRWLKLARMEIDWARAQGKGVMVVGGTGLYIKALMEGIAEIPDIDPLVREQAANDYEAMGKEAFAERLRAVDPGFFERLAVWDRQRLVRAYAVWLGSGKALSWWQAQGNAPPYAADEFRVLQPDIGREELYARCDARFVTMVEEGAVDEVRALNALGLPPEAPARKSVGVKELTAYLDGALTLPEAITLAQQATRHYAKRQLTWFRNQLG